uniref:Unknown protein n=1 Tax=Escherichia coli TaxID=562 RepID=Q47438_ECOLX|nr:unnamed protein product [Escherichia coli]
MKNVMSVSLVSLNFLLSFCRSVSGGDSKWIAVQPLKTPSGRLCNKRGPGSLRQRFVYDIACVTKSIHQRKAGWPDIRICEAFKVLAMLVLLVVALAVLKAVFLPLIVTWVLVLVVQILAPAVINNKA